MPCEYVVVQNGNGVLEKWTGTMTLDDLIAHKKQLAEDARINPGAAILSDCRRASIAIPLEGIGRLSEMESGAGGGTSVHRYAFLVPHVVYEKARAFADQATAHGKSVIIFNALNLACTWLGMDFEDVSRFVDDA